MSMRRASAGLLAAAILAVGLVGTYSYWENYYVHRGFAAPHRLSGAKPGRLFKVRFFSAALGRQADYMVYLPAGYSRHRPLPVFYLLHGIPGRPISYSVIGHIEVRLDNLISRGRTPRMILVFPDGRIDGSTFSDSEWANTPSGRFETYVVDVVRDVDHRFAARADRSSRVIGGLSAGAYGALNIALHHLAVFGSVQAWSGYFKQTRAGVFADASRADLAYNSPFYYVRKLKRELARFPLRAFLLSGRGDQGTRRQVSSMANALRAEGAHATWALYPGGHDWALWNTHLDGMLVLAGADVSRPLRVPIRFRVPRAHPRPLHTRPHRRASPAHAPVRAGPARVPVLLVGARLEPSTSIAFPGGEGAGALLGGLLLALLSAAAINLGFLLQHRGLRTIGATRGLVGMVGAAIRNPTWLGGQVLGWAGFATQIIAVSIAPLSLVQAFAAGGLALSVPLAAGLFGYTISRTQRNTVLLVAAALATLPIGISSSADVLDTSRLVVATALLLAVALPVARSQSPATKAIAAGLLYGVADASIKAVAVDWSAHGSSALVSGWTLVAILATFGGFLAFQVALRDGSAVSAISLSTALCALVGVGCSLFAFGETLGGSPLTVAWHLAAIAVVLGCVPTLAAAQAEIEDSAGRAPGSGETPRPLGARLRTALRLHAAPHERTAGGE
jgi:enterochelin esterase-like enzyme